MKQEDPHHLQEGLWIISGLVLTSQVFGTSVWEEYPLFFLDGRKVPGSPSFPGVHVTVLPLQGSGLGCLCITKFPLYALCLNLQKPPSESKNGALLSQFIFVVSCSSVIGLPPQVSLSHLSLFPFPLLLGECQRRLSWQPGFSFTPGSNKIPPWYRQGPHEKPELSLSESTPSDDNRGPEGNLDIYPSLTTRRWYPPSHTIAISEVN